jgi:hypothetical protein
MKINIDFNTCSLIPDAIDGVVDPEEVLFDDEKDVTEDIGDKEIDDDSEIDTFDDVNDPEEVLFDDEKDVTEDIDDKEIDDDSEIDTFDDVIVPEEVLFDDEKDNKIPETIDTVDNDVEDLEDTLFEDEKIDEMDDKQVEGDSEIDQMPKEFTTEVPIIIEDDFEGGFEDNIDEEFVTTMQPIFDGESKVPVDDKEVCKANIFLIMYTDFCIPHF